MEESNSQELRQRIIAALKKVRDPEIPIDLYNLGLIYALDIEDGVVQVKMTLTTPNCPVAESMPGQVKRAVESLEGVTSVDVQLVWEPAWSGEKMSEDARAALEMMGISWRDPHGGAGMGGPGRASLTVGKTGRRDSTKTNDSSR